MSTTNTNSPFKIDHSLGQLHAMKPDQQQAEKNSGGMTEDDPCVTKELHFFMFVHDPGHVSTSFCTPVIPDIHGHPYPPSHGPCPQ